MLLPISAHTTMLCCLRFYCLPTQAEEIEALEAIFGPEWIEIDAQARTYAVHLDIGTASDLFELRLVFPAGYPSERAPVYELDAAWQSRPEADVIAANLDRIYRESVRVLHLGSAL